MVGCFVGCCPRADDLAGRLEWIDHTLIVMKNVLGRSPSDRPLSCASFVLMVLEVDAVTVLVLLPSRHCFFRKNSMFPVRSHPESERRRRTPPPTFSFHSSVVSLIRLVSDGVGTRCLVGNLSREASKPVDIDFVLFTSAHRIVRGCLMRVMELVHPQDSIEFTRVFVSGRERSAKNPYSKGCRPPFGCQDCEVNLAWLRAPSDVSCLRFGLSWCALSQAQLEHAHRVKDERSAEALGAKRNAADLEQKVLSIPGRNGLVPGGYWRV